MALFGTDGIRALAGEGPLASAALAPLGAAIARAVLAEQPRVPRQVVIGRDTRPSGGDIVRGLARGLAEGGLEPVDAGILPTPGISYLCRAGGFGLGLVVSASHNPPAWNGVKVFTAEGTKAGDDLEAAIEARLGEVHACRVGDAPAAPTAPTAVAAPSASTAALPPRPLDPARRAAYIDALVRVGGGDGALAGIRLVCDCAHGATAAVAPEVLGRLGAEVVLLAAEPLGERINDGVGALHPALAAQAVREQGAACGFSFDGDGDRVVASTEDGQIRDGDALLYALARWLVGRGRASGGAVAATVMSSFGLERALAGLGLGLVRTAVGDRHVTAAMLARGLALGGEQSGHIVVMSLLGPTGDGLGAALCLLAALRDGGSGRSSDLFAGYAPTPQAKRHVQAVRQPALEGLPAARAALAAAEAALAGRGRLLVRYSGTEPLLRILVEHEEQALADEVAEHLAAALRALPDLA